MKQKRACFECGKINATILLSWLMKTGQVQQGHTIQITQQILSSMTKLGGCHHLRKLEVCFEKICFITFTKCGIIIFKKGKFRNWNNSFGRIQFSAYFKSHWKLDRHELLAQLFWLEDQGSPNIEDLFSPPHIVVHTSCSNVGDVRYFLNIEMFDVRVFANIQMFESSDVR